MKHFLHSLKENLERIIPHLVESQVSLRNTPAPGTLEPEGQGGHVSSQQSTLTLGLQNGKNLN